VKSKMSSVLSIVDERRPDMIILIETWLDESEKFEIKGYKPYRNDRTSNGGGVLIAVKEHLEPITKKVSMTKGNLESLWITLNNKRHKIKIGAVYIPKENIGRNKLEEAFKEIEKEVELGIIGDFQTMVVGDTNSKIESEGESVGGKIQKEMVERLNFTITNETDKCQGKWTRIEGECKSRLDYVMTCERAENSIISMQIDEAKIWTPCRLKKQNGEIRQIYSDHTAIMVECNWTIGECGKKKQQYTRHGPAEMKRFEEMLKDKKFKEVLNNAKEGMSRRYEQWSEMVAQAYENAGKKVTPRNGQSKEERLLNQKYKNLRKIQNQQGEDKNLTEEIQKVKEEILEAEGRRINNTVVRAVQEMKKKNGGIDQAKFWEIHKKITQRRREPQTTSIKDKEGNRKDDKQEVLKVYKEFYEELLTPKEYTTERGKQQERLIAENFEEIIKTATKQKPMEITTMTINRIIEKLKKRKAPDREQWRNEMLIGGGTEIEEHLRIIFNQISNGEEIPQAWQQVKIKSIHKKGSTLEMNNRRGIFITNVVSKVWEKVLLERMNQTMKIDINQNGGQKGRGTLDNLMAILSIQQMAKHRETYIVFADAKKCFDRLWLKDCIKDLKDAGVREAEARQVFKLNKKCQIIIDTPVGSTQEIEIGEIVKQGTVLGPQLCCASTMMVNKVGPGIVTSMAPGLQVNALAYVDDIAGAGSKLAAENTLKALKEMEETKKFTFSTSKTKILHIGKKKNEEELSFELREGMVRECQEYKYLGTWLNQKGNFSRQLQEIEQRAGKIAGVINCHGQKAISMELATKLFLYTETGTNSIFGDVELWPALTKTDWES
uniref:Reverse transcriptase domain-containing protein n=1 Tax=Clytia hemisphaerica TaxID=252671 RepID=A0A7M5VCA9_9CNID